jgi:hypothetical protein
MVYLYNRIIKFSFSGSSDVYFNFRIGDLIALKIPEQSIILQKPFIPIVDGQTLLLYYYS